MIHGRLGRPGLRWDSMVTTKVWVSPSVSDAALATVRRTMPARSGEEHIAHEGPRRALQQGPDTLSHALQGVDRGEEGEENLRSH